jgi:hypothetical protein
MDQNFLNTYEPMSNTLCQLGWFVAPFMIQWEYDELRKICDDINREPNLNPIKKKEYTNKINSLLSETAFQPNYRAFFLFRSKEVPHVSEYSHLYERSIYHYFKLDYTSSILTLLPAIEGSLLSYYGWSFSSGARKPRQDQFLSKLKTETINSGYGDVNRLFEIYGRVLADFLEKWIFPDTNSADLSTSWLNRHILAHGMAPANINKQADANRLILFFDLLISYMSIPAQKYYNFIPDGNKDIDERRDYLLNLLLFPIPNQKCIEIEEKFLKQNKNYTPPEHLYGLRQSVERNQKKMEEILKTVQKIKRQKE